MVLDKKVKELQEQIDQAPAPEDGAATEAGGEGVKLDVSLIDAKEQLEALESKREALVLSLETVEQGKFTF